MSDTEPFIRPGLKGTLNVEGNNMILNSFKNGDTVKIKEQIDENSCILIRCNMKDKQKSSETKSIIPISELKKLTYVHDMQKITDTIY